MSVYPVRRGLEVVSRQLCLAGGSIVLDLAYARREGGRTVLAVTAEA
jgi:hypothetical protein